MVDSKILMLAYYYPPVNTVSVLRNYQISKEFSKYFSCVYLISSTNRKRLNTSDLLLPEIDIFDAFTLDYKTILSLKKNKNVNLPQTSKQNKFAALFIKLSRSVPFTLIIGEGGLFYILHSFFIAQKLIRQHDIKYVYSSFGPMSDHFTAYLLKLFFPALVWIADYRDLPVSTILDNVIFEKFQHRVHKFILKKAKIVTTVSNGLTTRLNVYKPNFYVLRNGIDENILNFIRTPFTKFTIAYTGSMYGYELVDVLAHAVQDLMAENLISKTEIEMIYAGKDTSMWQKAITDFSLENIFISKGIVSRETALEIQRNAHINLVFSATKDGNDGIMTTKFYEYLAAGNPIMVIINGDKKDEEFEEIMSSFNAGLVTYTSEAYNDIKNFILKIYQDFRKTGNIDRAIKTEKISTFVWEVMMNDFFEKL